MSVETVARRYAGALADVVIKSGEADLVKSELSVWGEMLSTNRDLHNAFYNPSINHANKEKVLESLLEKSKPSTTVANFLRVLLKNSRLTELNDISERFSSVLEERSGVVSASVTSSRELGEDEKMELKNNLAKMMNGKQVRLNFEIDKSVIGGIITRVGSTVYDGSVKNQLELLKEQMIRS